MTLSSNNPFEKTTDLSLEYNSNDNKSKGREGLENSASECKVEILRNDTDEN